MKMSNAVKRPVVALLALVSLASVSAYAALPASVATTVTGIQTDAQGIFDLIFPVVGVLLGLMIVIKLFKRFGNRI